MFGHIVKEENAVSLFGAALAESQKAAQPAIGRAGRGVGEKTWGVLEDQPRADNEFDTVLFRREMGPHHAGKRIGIRDRNGRMLQRAACAPVLRRGSRPRRKVKFVVTSSSA